MEYLRPRLWEPMGIRRIFWETCPKGITKGGWGLFIYPEDAAKLGMLYLQNGNWKGRAARPGGMGKDLQHPAYGNAFRNEQPRLWLPDVDGRQGRLF